MGGHDGDDRDRTSTCGRDARVRNGQQRLDGAGAEAGDVRERCSEGLRGAEWSRTDRAGERPAAARRGPVDGFWGPKQGDVWRLVERRSASRCCPSWPSATQRGRGSAPAANGLSSLAHLRFSTRTGAPPATVTRSLDRALSLQPSASTCLGPEQAARGMVGIA